MKGMASSFFNGQRQESIGHGVVGPGCFIDVGIERCFGDTVHVADLVDAVLLALVEVDDVLALVFG